MKYVTDSKIKILMKRVKDETVYETKKRMNEIFKVTNEDTNLCGNVRVNFKDSTAKLVESGTENKKANFVNDHEQISSALALYRTISLFKCGLNAENCDFYKLNWSIHLKHESSGLVLGLGEWKGGFQIFTPAGSLKQLPKKFIKDVEDLLTFLVSKNFTIGYDGVVAGSVA